MNDDQCRPHQHQRPEAESSGVDPAPDEGPNSAGNYSDDFMHHTGVLKQTKLAKATNIKGMPILLSLQQFCLS
jgi:hypothetical protein